MIIIIDNYDSFVQTLGRYVREAGAETHLIRNDRLTPADILDLDPSGILISPGPKTPREAGICLELLAHCESACPKLPILGVCLGHQAMVAHDGGRVVHAGKPLHGEASLTYHDQDGIFEGLPSPIKTARYHSLIGQLAPTNSKLIPCAWSEEKELMGVRHNDMPWYGVQFHPESLLTEFGSPLIKNFVARSIAFRNESL